MRSLLIFLLILLAACKSKHEDHTENTDVYYTCSMDPQVMETKPGKCPICKMPLTPVKRSEVQKNDEIQLSDQQVQLGNIHTDTVSGGFTGSRKVLTAVLNFDLEKTFSVSSRVMGRIERLYFKNVGDRVRKGDKLFDLYSEELNNAKQEYLLASERQKTFTEDAPVDFTSLVESSRNKLKLWGMSDGQIKQLEQSGEASPVTSFYSTANGYITSLEVNEGDYLMEGGTVMQLADLSTVWAEAQVYSTEYAYLDPKASVTVRVPGFDEEIRGSLITPHPEIAPGTRINLVHVSIPNKGNRFKPGMQAYVYMNSARRSTLLLPSDAVIRDSKGATIWVQTGPNTFKSRMVIAGDETDGFVEIKRGLTVGDVVVVSGAYLLQSEYIFKKGANPMAGPDISGM